VLIQSLPSWLSDKFVLDLDDSDDEDETGGKPESSTAVAQRRAAKIKKLDRHGLALQPCKHVFCGVSFILVELRIEVES